MGPVDGDCDVVSDPLAVGEFLANSRGDVEADDTTIAAQGSADEPRAGLPNHSLGREGAAGMGQRGFQAWLGEDGVDRHTCCGGVGTWAEGGALRWAWVGEATGVLARQRVAECVEDRRGGCVGEVLGRRILGDL